MIQTFRELHSLHKLLDMGAGLLEQTTGVPSCVPNCGRCCEQNTTLCTTIEAINMISYLPHTGNKILKSAVDEAEGWLLESHNLSIYRGVPDGVIPPDLMLEWKKVTKSQCPFLRSNKECSVYVSRPLTCRTFGVFRDIMDINCPRPLGKGETITKRAIIDSSGVKPLVDEFQSNCERKNKAWVVRGFAPTLLFRAAKPSKLKQYIDDNKIASAKLIGVTLNVDLMWQSQLDALRRGDSPMMVIQRDLVEV